jgi:hypothetical protein
MSTNAEGTFPRQLLRKGLSSIDAVWWTDASQFPTRPFTTTYVHIVMHCIYNEEAVFNWDDSNLRKIRAHRIERDEVEQALSHRPILVHEQSGCLQSS